jgi:hypothetical protein
VKMNATNSGNIDVSSNKLKLANPYRIHGGMRVVFGVLLFLILTPIARPMIEETIAEFQKHDDFAAVLETAPEQLLPLFVNLVACYFLLRATWLALGSILLGVSRFLVFFVPTGIPGPLEKPRESLSNLFSKRTIDTYEQPSRAMQIFAALVSSRFAYVRGYSRQLVDQTLSSIPKWLILLGCFSAPHFLIDGQDFPLPIALAVIAVFVTVIRVVALLASIPRTPSAEVYALRSSTTTAGNPKNFFNRISEILHQVRYESFPNRSCYEAAPKLGIIAPGETGDFESTVVIETQPLPVTRGIAPNGIILELGGWAVLCVVFAVMLNLNDLPLAPFGVLLLLLTGFIGLSVGRRMTTLGSRLHEVFHFESEVYCISMKGTYTSSRIGVGDGRGGQIYSDRASIQSDASIYVQGALLRTECQRRGGEPALKAPRTIVSSRCSSTLVEKCENILQLLESFQDSGGKIADIDLSNAAVGKIISVNDHINKASADLPAPEPQLALPRGPETRLEQATDTKECEKCAEIIKARAKLCRFCGYEFPATDVAEGEEASSSE